MKIKAQDLLNTHDAMTEIVNSRLSYKLSYKFMRILKEIDKELKILMEHRDKMLLDVCKKDDKGKPVIKDNKYQFPSTEIEEKVTKDIADFYKNTDVDLDCWLVSEQEILNEPNFKIEPIKLMTIDFLIEKPKEIKK